MGTYPTWIGLCCGSSCRPAAQPGIPAWLELPWSVSLAKQGLSCRKGDIGDVEGGISRDGQIKCSSYGKRKNYKDVAMVQVTLSGGDF